MHVSGDSLTPITPLLLHGQTTLAWHDRLPEGLDLADLIFPISVIYSTGFISDTLRYMRRSRDDSITSHGSLRDWARVYSQIDHQEAVNFDGDFLPLKNFSIHPKHTRRTGSREPLKHGGHIKSRVGRESHK
jgi:hypothetical protein